MYQRMTSKAEYALRRFEELVREDEMKGTFEPEVAEEIPRKLAEARKNIRALLPKEYTTD